MAQARSPLHPASPPFHSRPFAYKAFGRFFIMEKGLPYQTLVSSVLHQYTTGALKERA
ncbi:MAG: hypothetical protein Q8P78_02665 [bacterium]|nr:hypothetical protein [bacterium]